VLAMIADGVSTALWGQQAAALVVFLLLSLPCRKRKWTPAPLWMTVFLLALAATLLLPAVGGARRWLDLGIFNVNAAMLVLPALLIGFGGMRRFYPLLLCSAAVLCMQPDLSQLTALAAASLPLLWRGRKERAWCALSVIALAALMLVCVNIPTAIEPVDYCENILHMLGEISPLLMAAGTITLAAIPGFWAYRSVKMRDAGMLSLAVYYASVMFFGLSGEYPMPVMGFGLSPIAGYFLACMLMPQTQESTSTE